MINQFDIVLPFHTRGFHLITPAILSHLPILPDKGMLFLCLQHTSAALTLNENADPSVRVDFETFFNKLIPNGAPYLTHQREGEDDMPAHIKAALIGNTVTIPIANHKLCLGVWQGIYLCEFRSDSERRKIIATIFS